MRLKRLLCGYFLVVFAHINAQRSEEPYLQFSSAYKTLDAALLANAYAENAVLINLYDRLAPQSYKGRTAILAFFMEQFTRAERDKMGLDIVFKISSRKKVQENYLDNGFYRLKITHPDIGTTKRFGKFSIVLQQESGVWKFSVDANGSATEKEFENAIYIEEEKK
ncbi:MAG: hypothetical protein AAF717_16450 [Bacteroidota bacterium]